MLLLQTHKKIGLLDLIICESSMKTCHYLSFRFFHNGVRHGRTSTWERELPAIHQWGKHSLRHDHQWEGNTLAIITYYWVTILVIAVFFFFVANVRFGNLAWIVFLPQVVELLNQAALISTEEKLIVLKQVLKFFPYCHKYIKIKCLVFMVMSFYY